MKISVVIPAFNSAPYIAETLESALAQTRAPHEIIVVDDASTDNTRDVARAFPVTLIELPQNGGSSIARNTAINAATGDTIATLDSDDIWLPNHLATLAALLEENPGAVLAASAIRLFGLDTHELLPRFPAGGPHHVFDLAFEHCVVWHSAVLYRKDAAVAAGLYHPEPYAEDMDLWMRMARRGPFVSIHAVTTLYRKHRQQVSAMPYRLKIASLRHRRRLVQRMIAEGDSVTATETNGRLLALWRRWLRESWRERDAGFIRALLAAHDVVPEVTRRELLTWARVAELVPLATSTWDRLPVGVRRLLKLSVG